MTDPSRDAPPTPERSRRRPEQDRGSTVSMTSTTTGLPDRYRPLDQVGPDEPTPTGVIRCWRAKDRVLNRDVAIRVHTPAGPAAHAWITRALTAGGLATPALAMVYDASEGIAVTRRHPGGAAYVVNEWIDGETLAERLARGPHARPRGPHGAAPAGRGRRRGAPGRARRRRADHRQRRPAAQRAGRPARRPRRHRHHRRRHRRPRRPPRGLPDRPRPGRPEPRPLTGPSDLVALVRRARSTEPGQGLSSVAAMASLLAERSALAGASTHRRTAAAPRRRETDSGWLRRLRDRRPDQRLATARTPAAAPPVPTRDAGARPARPAHAAAGPARAAGHRRRRSPRPPWAATRSPPAPSRRPAAPTPARGPHPGSGTQPVGPTSTTTSPSASSTTTATTTTLRARPPARPTSTRTAPGGTASSSSACRCSPCSWSWPWPGGSGKAVLSVAGTVDDARGLHARRLERARPRAPSASAAGRGRDGHRRSPVATCSTRRATATPTTTRTCRSPSTATPSTAWSTYEYRGSPAFGNLKDGVGLVLDLGGAQDARRRHLTTTTPGATVEIRTGDDAGGDLDSFPLAADGTLEARPREFAFEEPATAAVRAGLDHRPGGERATASPPTSPRSTVQAAG